MPIIGRLCCQFSGLLRASPILPVFQSDHHLAWNVCSRFYSRRSNAMKRAKKAEERALAKQNKIRHVKTSKILRPYPIDGCADKEPSTDNVWFQHMHPLKQLTFEEAIGYHRESVHETVYNKPGAYVNIVAVLNLKTRKQNVTLDKLKGSWMPPHLYPSGFGMRILAICKEKGDIEDALEAGAFTVGGLDIIQKITEGNIQVEEYDLVVAHTDILPNLAPIRGLMKTKMPRANLGTLGRDMADMIIKAKESRSYNLVCDNTDKSNGWVDDAIGKLNMPGEHLRENLREFLSGLLRNQPRVEGLPFVEQLYLRCPATNENFLLSRPTILREETKDLPGGKKETRQIYVGAGGPVEQDLEEEEAVQQ